MCATLFFAILVSLLGRYAIDHQKLSDTFIHKSLAEYVVLSHAFAPQSMREVQAKADKSTDSEKQLRHDHAFSF